MKKNYLVIASKGKTTKIVKRFQQKTKALSFRYWLLCTNTKLGIKGFRYKTISA